MIVGLTGGIGSGKSTISSLFRALGVPVYDSDKEAKLLMNTSKSIRKAIIALLGKKAFMDDTLNRDYISGKVFKDNELLERLNKIVHPEVKKHFIKWSLEQDAPYVIQETALIFENKNQDNYDKIILVTAPVEIRIARVIERDSVTKSLILDRINNQLTDAEKMDRADFIVENINLKKTAENIKHIHDQLLSEAELA
ncbi:dephospho-CoA kinase [uncultured Croceitalea sp.]|uniref:dephospho-CoA kinase n=1 Tax=uncultured Croceitalea sp. TaxID=1798908 RepID=UPI003306690D